MFRGCVGLVQDVAGVPTSVVQSLYADYVLVVVSQNGKMGSIVRVGWGAALTLGCMRGG